MMKIFFPVRSKCKIDIISMFSSSVILMNVVEFRKLVAKVFWKHLITEFIPKFSKFHVDHIV